jgi:CRP-like cAMP-binding protein
MRNLQKTARKEIAKQMILGFIPTSTIVFSQGEVGNYFYIIKSGQVELYINNGYIKTMSKGESFGDLALLHGAVRSGTIRTTEDTELWCLERTKFRTVTDYINRENYEENKSFIQSITILNNMENDQKALLTSHLIKEIYDPGSFIVKRKDIMSKI